MGAPRNHEPVKLFIGILSSSPTLLDEAAALLAEHFGPTDLCMPDLKFDFTDYYAASMGPVLLRRFLSFAAPIQPEHLADIKLHTNRLEQSFAERYPHTVPRPVNLDPGYLTVAKVVLATTKDNSHRIYLSQGIYAEITLHYQKGRYQPRELTYPDYRSEPYQQFFLDMRKLLSAGK
jgi:hypothetical protein